jgi:hypothetical protein
VPYIESQTIRAGQPPTPTDSKDSRTSETDTEPWPRIGRPSKHDVSMWTVVGDWPRRVPVIEREVDVFEAWFGGILDEQFGAP